MIRGRNRSSERLTAMTTGARQGPLFAFEDFAPGQVFELPGHAVSQADILRFASEFDPQPLHTDPAYAAGSAMGGLIASGWHTAAIFMRMQCDGFLLDTSSIVSPGVDEIRWLKPVRPGDTLSGSVEVTKVAASRSRADRGTVYCKVVLCNQHAEIVMTMMTRNIFRRRDAAQH